ncbi:hypothetical protein HYY69_06720 [Candidatus Woesearchaeota archaeon]|nr:hypothetical protein [Candidatus Woesearchaeota archaeon]
MKLSKSPSRYFNNPNSNLAKYHHLFTQLAWNLDEISKEAHAIGWENPSTNGYFLTISERAQKLSAAFKTKLVEYMPEQYEAAK